MVNYLHRLTEVDRSQMSEKESTSFRFGEGNFFL